MSKAIRVEVIGLRQMKRGLPKKPYKVGDCQADNDGDCDWKDCPQKKNYKDGCPLYDWNAERI